MTIEPFSADDIPVFLELAAEEGWMAEPWEFEFLLAQFSQGCFSAYGASGETAGFVTAMRHDNSGWIGNLIVSAEYRGQGIGERLFTCALGALRSSGVETVWLTASKSGKSLYEKYDFSSIDTVIRWVGAGRQRHIVHEATPACNDFDRLHINVDSCAWGDRREALLAVTAARGRLLQQDSGFAVLQPCGDALQIGPFSAQDDSTANVLMQAALHKIPFGKKVYLDAPASNRSALRLYNRKRMQIAGSTELMYAGIKPAYHPEYIYGLATMGSCG